MRFWWRLVVVLAQMFLPHASLLAGSPQLQSQAVVEGAYLSKPKDPLTYPTPDQFVGKFLGREMIHWPITASTRIDFDGYVFGQDLSRDDAVDESLLMSSDRLNRSSALDQYFYDRRNVQGAFYVDRLSLSTKIKRLNVTLGRFPIDLSKTFIFRPNDLFGRFRSYQLDRSHKPGVDALKLTYPIKPLGELELISVAGYGPMQTIVNDPGQDENKFSEKESSSLLYFGNTYKGFYGAGFGGRYGRDTIFGGALEGEFWHKVYGLHVDYSQILREETKQEFVEFTLGIDRKIFEKWLLQLEVFHNGEGATRVEDYNALQFDDYHQLTYWGRYYAAFMISHTFDNLTEVRSIVQQNILDESVLLTLYLRYPLRDNLEIAFTGIMRYGAEPAYGKLKSEYGAYPNVLNMDLTAYF